MHRTGHLAWRRSRGSAMDFVVSGHWMEQSGAAKINGARASLPWGRCAFVRGPWAHRLPGSTPGAALSVSRSGHHNQDRGAPCTSLRRT